MARSDSEIVEFQGQRCVAQSHWEGRERVFTVKMEVKRLEYLDWNKLPSDFRVRVQDKEYRTHFRLIVDGKRIGGICFDLAEFKQLGLQSIKDEASPNAAQLRKIREDLPYLRRRYREDLESTPTKGVIARLTWSEHYHSYQATKREELVAGWYTTVYKVHASRERNVTPGVPMYCTPTKYSWLHEPSQGRDGFRIVEVSPSHLHFDPDHEIRQLETEIKRGNP